MNKILIVSYYYPPNENIPSWRANSWAKYLAGVRKENEVHVVTRYWNGKERNWKEQIDSTLGEFTHKVSAGTNLNTHYVATNKFLKRLLKVTSKMPVLKRSFNYFANRAGYLQLETDSFFAFRKYISKTFPDNYFDIIIVTSPPMNVVRLGYDLRRKFKKAFLVSDFRDLWNIDVLKSSYSPTSKERFYDSLYNKLLKRWLSRYNLLTGISSSLVGKLAELNPTIQSSEITNGYDQDLFAEINNRDNNFFYISSVGTLYGAQQWPLLVDGLIQFAKNNNLDDRIKIQFIGTRSFNPEMTKKLESNLPSSMIEVTDRIERKAALQIMKNAGVLVYPAWDGYKGIYPGKIFEYLASGNNILIVPSDYDVIEQLLSETKAGVCRNTKEEVVDQLQKWYDEWKIKGFVSYHGVPDNIEKYSRERQAHKLAELIGI